MSDGFIWFAKYIYHTTWLRSFLMSYLSWVLCLSLLRLLHDNVVLRASMIFSCLSPSMCCMRGVYVRTSSSSSQVDIYGPLFIDFAFVYIKFIFVSKYLMRVWSSVTVVAIAGCSLYSQLSICWDGNVTIDDLIGYVACTLIESSFPLWVFLT